jgi:hypothetical protein
MNRPITAQRKILVHTASNDTGLANPGMRRVISERNFFETAYRLNSRVNQAIWFGSGTVILLCFFIQAG